MHQSASVHTAILLLGSNLGQRESILAAALQNLAASCGNILQKSAIYESEVWGTVGQADYLNIAVALQTSLSPEDLLHCCQQVESAHGRQRTTKWAARTLDIDILFYGGEIIDLPHLKIPHPLLRERRFVLLPLAEIMPDFQHPQGGFSMQQLLADCPDSGRVWLWQP